MAANTSPIPKAFGLSQTLTLTLPLKQLAADLGGGVKREQNLRLALLVI